MDQALSPQYSYGEMPLLPSIVIPDFQVKRHKYKEGPNLAKGYKAAKWQVRDSSSRAPWH